MAEKTYSITELTDLTDVTERTVRYYITLGLLPKPEGIGRWSHYTEEHLNRLTLIRKLQEGHMPLSEIGEFIKALDAQEAEAKASQRHGFGEKLRKKGKGEKAGPRRRSQRRTQRRRTPATRRRRRPIGGRSTRRRSPSRSSSRSVERQLARPSSPRIVPRRERSAQSETSEVGQRTRWEHIVLAPGVELNVKVTRSGKQKAAVEALIERAKELFPRTSLGRPTTWLRGHPPALHGRFILADTRPWGSNRGDWHGMRTESRLP